jgi:hypothetical protein
VPVLSPLGEAIHAALRKMNIAAQAVVVRVDATMMAFDVYAQLVSNNTDFLQRHHYFEPVYFVDGSAGDNGFVMEGTLKWPDEFVVFTDGTNGDNGLVVTLPLDLIVDALTFTEDAFFVDVSIHDDEFVAFADFGISYIIAFNRDEQFVFSELSVAWSGVINRNEAVFIDDSLTIFGGNNTVFWHESVNISETVVNDISYDFTFGDAVTMFEFWDTGLVAPSVADYVTWTDTLVVSQVAATDARPGAFVPGAALLGSPS